MLAHSSLTVKKLLNWSIWQLRPADTTVVVAGSPIIEIDTLFDIE